MSHFILRINFLISFIDGIKVVLWVAYIILYVVYCNLYANIICLEKMGIVA